MLSTLHWGIAGEAHRGCSRVDPGLDTKEKSNSSIKPRILSLPPCFPHIGSCDHKRWRSTGAQTREELVEGRGCNVAHANVGLEC